MCMCMCTLGAVNTWASSIIMMTCFPLNDVCVCVCVCAEPVYVHVYVLEIEMIMNDIVQSHK